MKQFLVTLLFVFITLPAFATKDVTSYGAVPNDATDDATAVGSAITAAAAGETILFPPGEYLISGITISKRVILRGDGATLKATGNSASVITLGTGSDGSLVTTLNFKGSTNEYHRLLNVESTSRVTIEHCTFDGYAAGQSLRISGSPDVIVRDNRFEWRATQTDDAPSYQGAVLLAYYADRVLIEGNLIAQTMTLDSTHRTRGILVVSSNDAKIALNHLSAQKVSPYVSTPIAAWGPSVGNTPTYGTVIVGNTITGGYGNQIYIASRQQHVRVVGNTIYDFYSDDSGAGVAVANEADHVVIADNIVRGGSGSLANGISISSFQNETAPNDVLITGNQLLGNSQFGMYLTGTLIRASNNIVKDNAYGQVYVAGTSATAWITENTVSGTARFTIASGTVIMRNNDDLSASGPRFNGATPTTTIAAGEIGLGTTTATTVGSAGSASALPSAPAGYLVVNIGGTLYKVPYYNN
jgi:hypothetical protein